MLVFIKVTSGQVLTFGGASPLEGRTGQVRDSLLCLYLPMPTHTDTTVQLCQRWATGHIERASGWSGCSIWQGFISFLCGRAGCTQTRCRSRQPIHQGYWLGWNSNSGWGWLLWKACGKMGCAGKCHSPIKSTCNLLSNGHTPSPESPLVCIMLLHHTSPFLH